MESHADLTVEERLRRQVARELHDQVAQALTTMLVDMEHFKFEQAGRNSVIEHVTAYQDQTREVLNNVRQMLYDLRGQQNQTVSLADMIGTGLLQRFQERTGIKVKLSVAPGWPKTLSRQKAINLYRIIQEAINNAWLHGGAASVHVGLGLARGNRIVVTVTDDGNGNLIPDREVAGMGLLGMRERASLLGGDLLIESRPGQGTTVRCSLPKELS